MAMYRAQEEVFVKVSERGDAQYYAEGSDRLLGAKFHRSNGPSDVSVKGTIAYEAEGRLHREDGPAYYEVSEDAYFYVEGIRYTEEQFNRLCVRRMV